MKTVNRTFAISVNVIDLRNFLYAPPGSTVGVSGACLNRMLMVHLLALPVIMYSRNDITWVVLPLLVRTSVANDFSRVTQLTTNMSVEVLWMKRLRFPGNWMTRVANIAVFRNTSSIER